MRKRDKCPRTPSLISAMMVVVVVVVVIVVVVFTRTFKRKTERQKYGRCKSWCGASSTIRWESGGRTCLALHSYRDFLVEGLVWLEIFLGSQLSWWLKERGGGFVCGLANSLAWLDGR